jgi:catechol 2,3-dioxygenase-like lactoylglutathione lyase family enzyme
MKFNHIAIMVADLERAIAFWCGVMGFRVIDQRISPDGDMITQAALDDVFRIKNAKAVFAMIVSDGGAMLELTQPIVPKVEKTPSNMLRYENTGIHELGLEVTDIDAWFDKIRAAGYETQTDYIWNASTFGRTFLFYDPEGNMIQLFERNADGPVLG